VHFAAVFNRQTTRKPWERISQFNCEITKLTKTVKNYPKIHGQTGGAVAPPPPPEYATDRIVPLDKCSYLDQKLYYQTTPEIRTQTCVPQNIV